MKVLGIECSSMMMGAAIFGERGLVAEHRWLADRSRSERIMPLIDGLLRETGVGLKDLGGISVSIGPGSFTGLRVGLSTAKGLGFALGLPLVGVSSLEVLAASQAREAESDLISPMIDAKRQEVYAALFGVKTSQELECEAEPVVTVPSAWLDRLERLEGSFVFVGSGALLFKSKILERLGGRARLVSEEHPYPSAALLAALGYRRLEKGEKGSTDLVPLYMSRHGAEVSLEKGSGLQFS
jgi:tRNA threonylcarbamoyladenosine biosynthesis protein TsaB